MDEESSLVTGIQKWSNEAVVICWLVVFGGKVDLLEGRLAVLLICWGVGHLIGIILLGIQEFGFCLVGYAEQVEGVITHPSFDIIIVCAVDVDLAIYPLELAGTGVVRKIEGGLDFDEGFVGIVVFV